MANHTKLESSRKTIATPLAAVSYQSGFGNQFQSEAVPGALPIGRNSPQRGPLGLYAEQISGTAFTAARHENRRTWTYRIWPSVVHKPYRRIDNGKLRTGPFNETEATPSQLRWSPFPIPQAPTDFIDGIITIGGSGSAADQSGMAVHVYTANASMAERYFYNADGEMLIVPQQGRVRFVTELGILDADNGEIAVIPRGLRFRVELPDGPSRGYICENYGQAFRLPELGPLGANGLANPRDFQAPVAAYDAKAEGFLPGGASLHNCMSAHGPDAETFARASSAELKPQKLDNTLAFMFESRFAMRLTRYAMESAELQHDYFEGWQGLTRHFPGK